MGDGLEGAERLVELLPVLGVLHREDESKTRPGPNPRDGWGRAGVIAVSPLAARGGHGARCLSDPNAAMRPPLIPELAKCGDGARDRPNSSWTTTPSSMDIPEPPHFS